MKTLSSELVWDQDQRAAQWQGHVCPTTHKRVLPNP